MHRSFRSRAATVGAGLLLVSVASFPLVGVGQGLVDKVNERMAVVGGADADDPVALLRQAAEFTSKQPQATLDLAYHLEVEKGDEQQKIDSAYRVVLGDAGRFAIGPLGDTPGPRVHADGQEMIVVPPGETTRTMRFRISQGVAAFASSRPASWIGHGLGGLTLSLLSPVASEQLLGAVQEPVSLGKETIRVGDAEHACYHGRVTTGELTWDFWVDAGPQPLLRRIVPDLSSEPNPDTPAEEVETAKITIDFNRWDLKTKPADATFATTDPPHEMLGKPAPPVTLPLLDGGTQRLQDLIGKKVILIDFWATWCPPCIASLPTLDSVAQEYADKGVAVFAVNAGDEADAIKTFLAERDWKLPIAQDLGGEINAALKAGDGLPTSVLIGLDGKIQLVKAGVPGDPEAFRKQLVEEFDALLAKKDLASESIENWRAMQAAFTAAK